MIERTGLCKGYGGPTVFEDIGFDLGRGERLLVLGLNGAGKTSLLRILAGETEADLGQFEFGYQVQPGYYAQEHDNLAVTRRCSPTSVTRCRQESSSPRPSCVDCSACSALGRQGVPGVGHAVGRREDQAGVGDADGRPQQPAAARRADQQPRPAVARGGGRRARRLARGDHLRQPRHRVRAQLDPTKVLLMPDGDVDYFSEDWLELVSMA